MEIQFEQNRDFNQSHRESPVTDTNDKNSKQPQGREGDPNQRLVNREELNTEEKMLDRRPADVEDENFNPEKDRTSSAIPGIQSDSQNTTRNSGKPLGEDPNVNAERENKEENDELEKGDGR